MGDMAETYKFTDVNSASTPREATMSTVYQRALLRKPMLLLRKIILLLSKQMFVVVDVNITYACTAFDCVLDVLGVSHDDLFESVKLAERNVEDSNSFRKFSEEEAEKLTKLKENLLKLDMFLASVLLHYSSLAISSELPAIEKIKQASETISKAINRLRPDRLKELVPVTEEDVLCSVLGLNDEFANRLTNLRFTNPGMREHKSEFHFLSCFLKECYESSDPEDLPDDAARLRKMGFTENRSNVVAKWIAQQPLPEHKSILAWAHVYLKNLFHYDIFLNNCVSTFPYNENHLNAWFRTCVQREGGEDGGSVQAAISAINTTTTEEAIAHIEEKTTEFRRSNPNGQLYFHGTDHNSAKDILENGIKLREGEARCDFSHRKGFYVTNDYGYALDYAHAQVKASAVIIFNISDDYLQSLRYLDLIGPTKRSDWQSVTKFFRSGENMKLDQRLYNEIEKCQYIIGSISGGRRRRDLIQICIKKKQMALEVGNPAQIVGSVFLNTMDA